MGLVAQKLQYETRGEEGGSKTLFENVKEIICFGQEGLLLHFIFDRPVKQFWKHIFEINHEGPIRDFPISSDQP